MLSRSPVLTPLTAWRVLLQAPGACPGLQSSVRVASAFPDGVFNLESPRTGAGLWVPGLCKQSGAFLPAVSRLYLQLREVPRESLPHLLMAENPGNWTQPQAGLSVGRLSALYLHSLALMDSLLILGGGSCTCHSEKEA